MKKTTKLLCLALILVMTISLFSGCSQKIGGKIILATTTSTTDTGLLDYLLPKFKEKTGVDVQVISVGTGAAITMGKNGEADVILVHARADEDKFMANGDGILRYDVMYNDFILVGPANDPAGVLNQGNDIKKSLEAIQTAKSTFISRGDNSGTHKKELEIWKSSNLTPSGDWYIQAATGMGAVITMANEKNAYTLTDRGTYLSMKDKTSLKIVCEKDTNLLNPYGVIVVNPKKNDKINEKGAKAFADWIVSAEAQELIKNYGVDKYGQALFVPSAKK